MTRTRDKNDHQSSKAVIRSYALSELAKLVDLPEDEARRAVLADLGIIRDCAMNRTYQNKRGQEISTPDVTAAANITAVAAELAGVGAYRRVRIGRADLSVFNGGKAAAETKAG